MKKICLLLSLMLLPLVGSAQSVEIDRIYYALNSEAKTAEVTGIDPKYSVYALIPEMVSYENIQYRVTSIRTYAFESCSSLSSVTIPNSVTNRFQDFGVINNRA